MRIPAPVHDQMTRLLVSADAPKKNRRPDIIIGPPIEIGRRALNPRMPHIKQLDSERRRGWQY